MTYETRSGPGCHAIFTGKAHHRDFRASLRAEDESSTIRLRQRLVWLLVAGMDGLAVDPGSSARSRSCKCGAEGKGLDRSSRSYDNRHDVARSRSR